MLYKTKEKANIGKLRSLTYRFHLGVFTWPLAGEIQFIFRTHFSPFPLADLSWASWVVFPLAICRANPEPNNASESGSGTFGAKGVWHRSENWRRWIAHFKLKGGHVVYMHLNVFNTCDDGSTARILQWKNKTVPLEPHRAGSAGNQPSSVVQSKGWIWHYLS